MKKTTLISGLLLSTLINAQTTISPNSVSQSAPVNTGYVRGGGVLVSDPTDTATVDGGSVSCNAGGLHADNSYFRGFDIDGLGQIEITDVDIGVETAASGNGVEQPIVIRVYSIPDGSALPAAALTLVTEVSTVVPDNSATVVNFPISAMLDAATQDLVVEVFTPDGQTDGHSFFIGSNASTDNFGPLFLAAEACGITSPTAVGDIGFPDMHGIMVVNGLANVPVELMNFSIE